MNIEVPLTMQTEPTYTRREPEHTDRHKPYTDLLPKYKQ